MEVFKKEGIEHDPSADFYDFLESSIPKINTSLDDWASLQTLKRRTLEEKKETTSMGLALVEEMRDNFSLDEKKTFKQLKQDSEMGAASRKAFKEKWAAKMKDARAKEKAKTEAALAAPKKKMKKGFAKEAVADTRFACDVEEIEMVGSMARISLPPNTQEQHQMKKLLPPNTSIWNNWKGMAWCLHTQGFTRDSEPWCDLGRDDAGYTLIARAWRL